jgi:4-diphosphocytidyl-2-C-methyl-D-erythritol kinase
MLCFPNAKINLGLHVVEKRKDGYHDIETCFYPIPLRDALEIVPASEFSFTQVGLSLDSAPPDNLVMKALHLYGQQYDIPPLSVYLKKAVPFGAGLGGGSADAAFMLKLLNTYTSHNATDDELEKIAVEIGADCPFFIRNTPTIASGIGNIFDPIELSLKGYILCIIKPNLAVSTKEAYASVKPAKPSLSLREILQRPVKEWRNILKNDFESAVFQKYPVIAEIKAFLYAQEAVYAAMSGSGSAVFGLFEKDVDLTFPDCFTWTGILK